MNKFGIIVLFLIICLSGKVNTVSAHCEVPCGIYGDSIRVALLFEHVQTIEKGMKQIEMLSSNKADNYNQLVRWVVNKEEHACEIQEIATQYFLFQRVKIADGKKPSSHNAKLLDSIHKICVYAMQAKQSTDTAITEKLRNEIDRFSHLYFEGHEH